MSLIKEYKGRFYVFIDINAESWGEKKNKLSLKGAAAICNSRDEAFEIAKELDSKCGQFEEGTEYGVQFNRLCKDDASVILTED